MQFSMDLVNCYNQKNKLWGIQVSEAWKAAIFKQYLKAISRVALTNQIERGVLSFFKGNLTVPKNQTNLNLPKGGKQITTLNS